MEDQKEQFEKYRDALRQEILRFSNFYYQFKLLNEMTQEHLAELNKAPCFFQSCIESFLSSSIVWATKLLDERSEKGIVKFIDFSKKNPSIFGQCEILEEKTREFEKKLGELNWKKSIKIWRDKYYAHFDTKFFFDQKKLEIEAPILWGDFEEIINTLAEILNFFSANLDGKTYVFEFLNKDDLKTILKKLNKKAA